MSADRPAARWVVGALLGVVAVGLAAATLTSSVRQPQGSGGGGGVPGEQPGLLPVPETEPPTEVVDVPLVGELVAALVVALLLLAVAWALVNRREALKTAAVVAVALALGYLLFEALSGFSGGEGAGGLPFGGQPGQPGQGGDAPAAATDPQIPLALVVAVVGLAVLVTVAALLRSSGDEEEVAVDPADDGAAAVGRAAGRAADRIRDGTAADNEVYRTWREMTDLLDVANPAASTPGEFADAATDAGMARADVSELTDLFEEVRYGGAEPSDALERRAVAAFERIEATYAEEA